jgi:Lamin Tail Domain/CHU_C Type IX secretion signal domain
MRTNKIIGFTCLFVAFFGFLSAQTAPYDILINEFMPDPTPQIGLPNTEFIELFNRSNKIVNLKGFKLVNGSVSTVLPTFVLKPAAYVVIYTKKTGVDFGKVDTIQVSKLVTLSNPNDTFYLAAPNGDIIDATSYDLTFYQNSKKADGGWSLERTQPNAPCNGLAWTASNDLVGGTPGKRNTVAFDLVDKTPPLLERYFVKDDKTIVLTFDKSLDRFLAEQPNQYQILEGTKISSSKISSPFFFTVQLSLSTALQAKRLYKLVVKTSLKDCQGMPLSIPDTLDIQLPEKPARNDLIVNEILINPEVGGSRFVELYNRSEKALDIGGLKIADTTRGDVKTILTNFLLLPKRYIALTDNPSYIRKRYKVEQKQLSVLKNKLPTWNENSGNVTVYAVETSKSVVLDSFTYEKSWHNPLLATSEGVSLEKVNPNLSSSAAYNWQSASERSSFATPAQKNSQYRELQTAPSVVSAPFWVEKNRFSPDDDGFEDVLLVQYKLEKVGGLASIQIFDSQGRFTKSLTDNELLGTEGVIRWQGERTDGTKAPVGIYILVIDMSFSNGSTTRQKLPVALLTQF